MIDDLDGTIAHTTVEFNLDSFVYEIDLSSSHAAQLREALAPYVAAARRTAHNWPGHGVFGPPYLPESRVAGPRVREWARAHGMSIAQRGRIPSNVLEAYQRRNAA